jgi:hypothetical protein
MAIPTAEELSGNAAFQGLLSVGLGILPAHAAVIHGMDAEQLRTRQAEAEALAAQLRTKLRDRSEISESELNQLAELAGLSPATIRAIGERVHAHGTELNQAFPDLQSLDNRARSVLVFDAIRRDEAAMAVVKRVAGERAADDPNTTCTAQCFVTFMLTLIDALIDTTNLLQVCTLLVFPPIVLLCGTIAMAIMIARMEKANSVYTECIEDCQQPGEDVG